MKCWMKMCVLLLILGVLGAGYFAYMNRAFPGVGCDAAKASHLSAPGMEGDCYSCHMKATPAVAQQWYESKHGVTLVRCQTCHGMPDGKGALSFARKPALTVCAACHSAAIQRMEAKFGLKTDCATCHLQHQSAIHGEAYQHQAPSTKTEL